MIGDEIGMLLNQEVYILKFLLKLCMGHGRSQGSVAKGNTQGARGCYDWCAVTGSLVIGRSSTAMEDTIYRKAFVL